MPNQAGLLEERAGENDLGDGEIDDEPGDVDKCRDERSGGVREIMRLSEFLVSTVEKVRHKAAEEDCGAEEVAPFGDTDQADKQDADDYN